MKIFIFSVAVSIVIGIVPSRADEGNAGFIEQGKKINQDLEFLPSSLVLGGKKYDFDQGYLEQGLKDCISTLENAKKSKLPESDVDSAKRRIAYQIMAAGLFAKRNDELMSLLDKAELIVGSETLPAEVSTPLAPILGVASQSFRDKEEDTIPVNAGERGDLGPRDYKTVFTFARMQLAARGQ